MLNNTGKRLAFAFLVLTFIFWLISMVTPGWLVISPKDYRGSVEVSLSKILPSTLFVFFSVNQAKFLILFPSFTPSLSLGYFLSLQRIA